MRGVDPESAELDLLKRRAKRQLRERARALRAALPAVARETRSRLLVERLLVLPELGHAAAVALFWPMLEKGEVDLRALHERLRSAGKLLYYPFMAGTGRSESGFARVDDSASLAPGGSGFLEPPPESPVARPGDLGVVVVPALSASADGHRLGYGLGFYDAILPRFCPPAVSVAVTYDFELLPELPSTANDVRCDVVSTDARTIRVAAPR